MDYAASMKQYIIVLTAAAMLAAALPAQAQMSQAPPVPLQPAEFAQTNPGQNVQIAVRVTRIDRTTIYAELLSHTSDTDLKATGKQVVIFFPDGTPVLMGSPSDVAPGAALFVEGVLTTPGHVDAKRVVVDTKYVTIHT
jgi:hypothetical protein